MNPHKTLSSYLVRPNLTRRHQRHWAGLRTDLLRVGGYNPNILSRTIVALLIWTALVGSVRYILDPQSLAQQKPQAASHGPITNSTIFQPGTSTALASVAHAAALPGGPTGELIPPGTMAPDKTYANGYARGQCTWYVAGRRQIPANWSHARHWYYNAMASGWSVGTTPAVAAIAWTSAGYYGHVALVEKVSADGTQVYISEMNYQRVGVKTLRWVPKSEFKYIY